MVLSDDLMFSQMVANALPDDCSIRPASNQVAAESSLDEKVKAMIVDLSLHMELDQLVVAAKGAGVRVIGIASHVHVAKIQAARSAGFDEVLTRSQVADCLSRVVV
ncbi:hypothetical protein ACFL2H_13250 [Planctomycetota bacterium]